MSDSSFFPEPPKSPVLASEIVPEPPQSPPAGDDGGGGGRLPPEIVAQLAELASLRSTLAKAQTDVTSLTNERDSLRRQIDTQNAAVSSANDRITKLTAEYATDKARLTSERDLAVADLAKADRELHDTKAELAAEQDLRVEAERQVRVAKDHAEEIERLHSDPPAKSGITKITRFMTTDAHKYKTWPEARDAQAILEIMDSLGINETTAKMILAKRDLVIQHFNLADKETND